MEVVEEAVHALLGLGIGFALLAGVAVVATRWPSRARRRSEAGWGDTNHTSGLGANPDAGPGSDGHHGGP